VLGRNLSTLHATDSGRASYSEEMNIGGAGAGAGGAADPFVAKPNGSDALLEAIRETLAGSSSEQRR
jgi:hypothetical protein